MVAKGVDQRWCWAVKVLATGRNTFTSSLAVLLDGGVHQASVLGGVAVYTRCCYGCSQSAGKTDTHGVPTLSATLVLTGV